MLVKTFQAADMPEALRMVKAEFGPDAMILSSRKDRRRGFLGFYSKPFYEVTAAQDKSPRANPEPPPAKESGLNTLEAFQNSLLAPLARELKELRARVDIISAREGSGEPRREKEENQPRQRESSELAPRTLPRAEMEELKKVLLRSMTAQDATVQEVAAREVAPQEVAVQENAGVRRKKPREKAAPALMEQLAGELRENGVAEEAIRTFMVPVEAAAASRKGSARLREVLRESVAAGIRCAPLLNGEKGLSRIVALVGPTGVGKTTTIAKLAAHACKQGAKVALITIDTFRVGGVSQLDTYSGIMGLPLEVTKTPGELAEALQLHGDKEFIFIDTAGQSPRDRNKLLELKSFLAVNPEIETHLCLAATTRDRELAQTVDRFGVLPISRLIFTKLDESESFGSIVNTHLRDNIPLSCFTTGQRVPEDIEIATSLMVASLVVRENKS